ncbi:MAG: YifB family Mg chelatase-like AAA ATPase [Bacteroidales bacterium]|nr:YifB family Mg chelatase-like AAA ATPase [Bacteroidales bacterium]
MIINITSAKSVGIDAVPVTVEVDINLGIGIHLVGLADAAVKESLLRTVTALQSIGFRVPGKKIVINLAPADMHKKGTGYDVPIAVGIIAASGQMDLPEVENFLMLGELGLDASIRPVAGALAAAELARNLGLKGCILPRESASEALVFEGLAIYGAENLIDVIKILSGSPEAEDYLVTGDTQEALAGALGDRDYMDFSEIYGQSVAKRGLEIAAAGGHNVILIGAPGSGKTSLAKALAGILPPMEQDEAIVASKVYSAAGKRSAKIGLMRQRPFRAPHYSASMAAMIGGGAGDSIIPGEISLASGGVLFLDEFAQMPKSVAEALRGPIEDRKVVISRLHSKVEYPCSFILVAASNPCPCGYYGEKDRCTCTVGQRMAYLGRLSGPIMDRIDIQIWVHPVDTEALLEGHRRGCSSKRKTQALPKEETSAAVAARVIAARERQKQRFATALTNSEMSSSMMHRYCPLSEECEGILEKVIDKMGLSARAFSRIIKLARTIADLDCKEDIEPKHLLEAVSFRFLDKRNPF